jgi:heptosyltransferase-3
MKILIVMPDRHLGNLVISLCAIKSLRDFYGSEKVAIIFAEMHRELIAANLGLDNIIFYSGKWKFSPWNFLRKKMRQFNPTVSIALEGCSASALISYLSGAKRRIGLSNRKFSFLFTEKIPLRQDVHRLESYFDLIKKIAGVPSPTLISLRPQPQDAVFVDELLTRHNISSEKPVICIHTGAGKPAKQWPMENFAALIKKLVTIEHYQIIIVGSQSEKAKTDLITQKCLGKLYNFTGQLSVTQLIALFKRTHIMISNDSGPMHIATLSEPRVITLFGPTDDTIWGPLSKTATLLTGNATCSSTCAKNHPGRKARCFCAITVDTVISAVQQQLAAITQAVVDPVYLNHS